MNWTQKYSLLLAAAAIVAFAAPLVENPGDSGIMAFMLFFSISGCVYYAGMMKILPHLIHREENK